MHFLKATRTFDNRSGKRSVGNSTVFSAATSVMSAVLRRSSRKPPPTPFIRVVARSGYFLVNTCAQLAAHVSNASLSFSCASQTANDNHVALQLLWDGIADQRKYGLVRKFFEHLNCAYQRAFMANNISSACVSSRASNRSARHSTGSAQTLPSSSTSKKACGRTR